MAKINRQAIVAKDHGMVDKLAGFKLQELRLIAFCLAHYDSRKPDNPEFKSSIQDLLDIFPGMDEKSAYDVVREAMIGINKKPLEFKEGNKRHFWNWFRGFTYYEGDFASIRTSTRTCLSLKGPLPGSVCWRSISSNPQPHGNSTSI